MSLSAEWYVGMASGAVQVTRAHVNRFPGRLFFSRADTDGVRKIGFGMHGDLGFCMPPIAGVIPYFLAAGADGRQPPEQFVLVFRRFLWLRGSSSFGGRLSRSFSTACCLITIAVHPLVQVARFDNAA